MVILSMQFDKNKERKTIMEQQDYTKKRGHLTPGERANIELLLKEKVKPAEIARMLGRHRSVITREIQRNSVTQRDSSLRERKRYFADAADRQYKARRKSTGRKIKLAQAMDMIKYTEIKIKKDKWSPDAAIGRAKIEHPEWESISTKTFYNYIDLGLVNVKPIDLHLKVRLRLKKKRVVKRKKILGKSITERPKEVENRLEFGHWEMDTVVGKREKSSVLLTLTERCTGMEILRMIAGKTPDDVLLALRDIKAKCAHFNQMFKTVTCDNGTEFSASQGMENALGVPVYYAHPYSSFERGTNENHNGIIRRFIPKGKSMDDIPESMVERIESFMNSLPRKRFGYQTPLEMCSKLLA